MNANELKEYIINNNKISLILEKVGCHGIKEYKTEYRAALPDKKNTTAVTVKKENLFTAVNSSDLNFTGDIFVLVMELKKISFGKANKIIHEYLNLEYKYNKPKQPKETNDLLDVFKKVQRTICVVNKDVEIYDDSILKYLPRPRILPWEEEGITNEVIQRNNIAYDPVNEGIVIPHYNIDGKLIGIRERTLIKEEETKGKYRPAIIAGTMYNHPLGFTLYNLNNSKTHIKDMKKVFLFESEKSCLLYQSYFGFENDISCACCGSSFIKYQLDLLLNLGVKEVMISFDKQFKELGDEECSKWTKKLKGFYQKYSPYVTISFLFDKSNLLDYKMSPIDNGPENFLQLYKNRIFL